MRWIGGGMDRRNLELRRQGWYVVKDVPAKLVPLVGRKRLRVTLGTRELAVARLRKGAALAKLEQQIAQAAGRHTDATWFDQAIEARETIVGDPGIAAVFRDETIAQLARAAESNGVSDTDTFIKVALGEATPLKLLVEPWLSEQDIEERSKGDHRKALKELLLWCEAEKVAPTLEAITRKVAGRYVSDLLTRKVDRTTIGKRMWSLRSFWRWLASKGHTEANPWRDQAVSNGGMSARDKEPERAFTDAEVLVLLTGTQDRTLLDMSRLAALSGMRVEEIALLQVKDVNLDDRTVMARKDPKTVSSRRAVPIHSAMLATIKHRLKGKDPEAYLFEELGPAPKAGRQRSMAFSKRFNRYREDMQVHERPGGQRRSLVNFHSFRRYFITKAEQAGQPENLIKSVVGHKRAGVTLGTYSAGASLEQRRAVVEAVRLPMPCRLTQTATGG